jgi:hypothetical protein
MADGEGFEPPEPLGSTVFKTAAIDHSATHPSQDTAFGGFGSAMQAPASTSAFEAARNPVKKQFVTSPRDKDRI